MNQLLLRPLVQKAYFVIDIESGQFYYFAPSADILTRVIRLINKYDTLR